VLKADRWYVIAGPGPRTYRVDQILAITVREEEFTPPEDFDLAGYWRSYQADFHARLHRDEARLAPLAASRPHRGGRTGTGRDRGRRAGRPGTRVLPIESLDHAPRMFLAMGADVEVLDPPELRERLAETVRVLASRYSADRAVLGQGRP
jgi:predicted DNA-binding transcriptional regulator YafY